MSFGQPIKADQSSTTDAQYVPARKALNALLRLMKYDMYNGNRYALAGVTMAKFQFEVLLKQSLASSIPNDVQEFLERAIIFSNKIIDNGDPATPSTAPYYFEKMQIVARDGIYERDIDLRVTNTSLVYPEWNVPEDFTYRVSDDCLSQLQGYGMTNDHPCTVSDECWAFMTDPNYYGFSLDHQLLYLMFGQALHCDQQFSNASGKMCSLQNRCVTVEQLEETMCANIVQQMKRFDSTQNPGSYEELVPTRNYQELFMEQLSFCGTLGYKDVCSPRWLDWIVSWQEPKGCYARTTEPWQPEKRIQEHLNIDVVNDHCDCHKTSLAAAALSSCIRILVEDPPTVNESQN